MNSDASETSPRMDDGAEESEQDIVDHLADLLARHKLVPFLGAGCSTAHVSLDWDRVTKELAADRASRGLGVLGVSRGQVAQANYNLKRQPQAIEADQLRRESVDGFSGGRRGRCGTTSEGPPRVRWMP